jgi:hypothetical protein
MVIYALYREAGFGLKFLDSLPERELNRIN